MRWGGAMIAAGVLGLVASALFVVAVLRAPDGAFSYAYDGFFLVGTFLQGFPRSALICAGLAGLYFSLDKAPESVQKMALTGLVLFSLFFVIPLTLIVGWALGSQDAYGPSSGLLSFLSTFFILSSVGRRAPA